MKRVYLSKDRTAIEILRNLFDQEGIATVILNENTAAVIGEVPFFAAMLELHVVRDEDEPRARSVVEQFESGTIRKAVQGEPWRCPKCGEMIEGQFTECWNCDLEDPRDDPEARCWRCGYLLRGLPERRCPECGERF